MSDHIQHAIDRLAQEIDAIDQRRGELQRAIDALRPLTTGAASTRTTKAAKKTRQTDRQTDRQSKPRATSDGASEPP